jgi:hypothetical protein
MMQTMMKSNTMNEQLKKVNKANESMRSQNSIENTETQVATPIITIPKTTEVSPYTNFD